MLGTSSCACPSPWRYPSGEPSEPVSALAAQIGAGCRPAVAAKQMYWPYPCPACSQQQSASNTAAEYARELLIRMHTDPSVNATWGTYWASLPGLDDTLGAELLSDEQLGLLQAPVVVSTCRSWCCCRGATEPDGPTEASLPACLALPPVQAQRARTHREHAARIYQGNNGAYAPLPEVLGEGVVSLDAFKHVAVLVRVVPQPCARAPSSPA